MREKSSTLVETAVDVEVGVGVNVDVDVCVVFVADVAAVAVGTLVVSELSNTMPFSIPIEPRTARVCAGASKVEVEVA